MQLVTMSGLGKDRTLAIIDAQRLATPDMTWEQFDRAWPELVAINTGIPLMSGSLLDDIGHAFNTGIRSVGSAVGLGDAASSLTDILGSVGHSITDNIGDQLSADVRQGLASYFGLSLSGKKNWLLIGGGVLVVLIVLYLIFRRRRR